MGVQENNLDITLITTQGCVACQIQHKLICEYLHDIASNVNVNYSKYDFEDYKAKHQKFDCNDFPLTIIKFKGKEIRYEGTIRCDKLIKQIDEGGV